MTVLHTWALAGGAAAIGLPVLVHWLTKPRPRRAPLPTIRFIQQIVHQRRARYRLRDVLVLLLRTLAVAVLALAFARPLLYAAPQPVGDDGGAAVRVVLLDVSQSMAAVSGATSALERARGRATDALQFSPGVRGGLVLVGAAARSVFDRPSSNLAALRQEAGAAAALPQRADVSAAIAAAARLFSAAGDGARKELVIVSDFQRDNWAGMDLSSLSADVRLQYDSVAAPRPAENLAITRISPQGRAEPGRPVLLEVEVGNYTLTARPVRVEVEVAGTRRTLTGNCPPFGKTTLTTEITPAGTGWLPGKARIVDARDSLPADDVRWFVLDSRQPPVYALVTREGPAPQPCSSHFLERALAPAAGTSQPSERVIRMDPLAPDEAALARADLLVLDHPGKLTAPAVSQVASLLRRGRSLLYVAAEPIDATNLKLIAEACGSDWRLPVEFSPAAARGGRQGLFIAEMQRGEQPFRVFGESALAVAAPLRFGGGLSSRDVEGGLKDDVLATLNDRSALLVCSACGSGKVAVLNADLTQSNLPGSTAFVPLVSELASRLLGAKSGDGTIACGEPVARFLPEGVTTPDGLSLARSGGADSGPMGELATENSGVLWRWPAAGAPGVYEVTHDGQAVYALATGIPDGESNLETMEPKVLTQRMSGGRSAVFRGQNDGELPPDSTWSWLLAACSLLLVAELLVLRVARS